MYYSFLQADKSLESVNILKQLKMFSALLNLHSLSILSQVCYSHHFFKGSLVKVG